MEETLLLNVSRAGYLLRCGSGSIQQDQQVRMGKSCLLAMFYNLPCAPTSERKPAHVHKDPLSWRQYLPLKIKDVQTSLRRLWADLEWRSQQPTTAQRNCSTAQTAALHKKLQPSPGAIGCLCTPSWALLSQRMALHCTESTTAPFIPLMCTNSLFISKLWFTLLLLSPVTYHLTLQRVMVIPMGSWSILNTQAKSSTILHLCDPNRARISPDWWQNKRSKPWWFCFSAVLDVHFYLQVLFIYWNM